MEIIVYSSDKIDDWQALYVDGQLVSVSDTYLINERIRELSGVIERKGDFLLGGEERSDAPQTPEEIEAYEAKNTQQALAQAEALEEQAAFLNQQAAELRSKATSPR